MQLEVRAQLPTGENENIATLIFGQSAFTAFFGADLTLTLVK
jgi:hypothetical protein